MIVVGLRQSEGEDLMAKVNNLLHISLGCDTVLCPAAVERVRKQNHLPGAGTHCYILLRTRWTQFISVVILIAELGF